MIRFYLDEMFSPVIVTAARARSLDITSSHEVGHDRMTDVAQLRAATREGRSIITENHQHFAPLARDFLARGEAHAGILLVPLSLSNGLIAALVDAIAHIARLYPDGIPNTVLWLSPAPPEDR